MAGDGATRMSRQMEKKQGRRGWRIVIAAVLVVLPVLLPPEASRGNAWSVLWLAAVLYLVSRLIRAVLRGMNKGRKARATAKAAEVLPVSWLLRLPLPHPRGAEATRNLPDYCARLLAK